MAKQATIKTPSGKVASGEVVREKKYEPSWPEVIGSAVTIVSAAGWPSGRTTVKDKPGNHWTGKKQ